MNFRRTATLWASISLVFLGTNLVCNKANSAVPPSDPGGSGRPGGCRGRDSGAHPRAGPRGLRGDGDLRSPAGHPSAEGPAGGDRGTSAGPEAARGQCGLDTGLLGLGRRAQRFPVDQRRVARSAARPPMGARLLGQVRPGSQWTSGYWADAKATVVQYLPEPPATAETGPNVAAPSPDSIWLPGCWIWNQNRYAWRPGFWAQSAGLGLGPSHYVWAPRGYVFVDGYWDYSLARRGVLFAPVYFSGAANTQPGFSYSPATVIDLGDLPTISS